MSDFRPIWRVPTGDRRKVKTRQWRDIDETEIAEFRDEVAEMAQERFGLDVDGDSRFIIRIIDKLGFEGPMPPRLVPKVQPAHEYDSFEEFLEEVNDAIDVAQRGASYFLSIARRLTEHVNRAIINQDKTN